MTASGRGGGTRRRRVSEPTTIAGVAGASSVPPTNELASAADEPAVELLDDRSISIAGARRGTAFGRSLTGAVAGTLLVVGMAFGAALGSGSVLGPSKDGDAPTGDTAAAQDGSTGHEGSDDEAGLSYGHHEDGSKGDWYGGGDEPDATTGPDATDGEKPDGEEAGATDKPDAVEPTEKPDTDPTPKPEPKPDPTKPPTVTITLALAIKEYHPFMEWGSCQGLDFDAYKVVRSSDSTVTWPTGDGDELIAVVEPGGARKAWDQGSPHGKKVWYRVFCVRHTDDGYRVVRASAAKGIEVPEEPAPPPPPDPIALALEASVNGEGKVVLSWSACDVDGFAFYKLVKSTWNQEPSYLPWTEGTQVLAAISDMGATEWHDWAPDAGHTAWYRVQCLGYAGDQKVLLGESAVVAVTTP